MSPYIWCTYLVPEKRGLFKKKSHKPARAMDDSGVDSMQKMGGGGLALRRQASDTNLASADYSGRAGAKAASAPGGPGKRAKSPFAIFRRPKTQDQSPIRAGDMQGRDTIPMHITVSSHNIISFKVVPLNFLQYFNIISYQVDVRTAKFLQKYKATENRICSLFGHEADRQLRNLCTIYKLPSGSSASKIINQIRENFFSNL